MKILIVIPYFYPSVGGLQNYALSIAKGLQKKGHEIIVITSNHIEKENTIDRINDCKIYRLSVDCKISNTPIGFRWITDIQKIIQYEKPDLINAHTPVPYISDIAAILAKKNAIPFVLTYQNDLIKDNFLLNAIIHCYYFILGNATLHRSDRIIASSQYYADSSKYLRKHKKKITIVSPGVYLDHYLEQSLDAETLINLKNKYKYRKTILFIGQLDKTHEHKGLKYLIEALLLVKEKLPGVRLIVIGKGDFIHSYKKLANKLGVEDAISFEGFISDGKLPYFYTIADVVILPSYNQAEGFGMVLIEAGASKKPVIASRVGGIPFVVKNGETGILIEPKNSKKLAESILLLLQDKVLSRKYGENNYEWVKDNFTWDKQIEKTHTLFLQLHI